MEEEMKQRQFEKILNMLTPQNIKKLSEQVIAVNIFSVSTLYGLVTQIFEKALMEPTLCEMYANLCVHLAAALPVLIQYNERITFKRLLSNKCKEEFERRGERDQKEANMSNEERKEKPDKAKRRMLGNIRFIGELYKKEMLTDWRMHEYVKKLLGDEYKKPDEDDVEALCELMTTIGKKIDQFKGKEYMDAYFDRMRLLSNNMNLSSRAKFTLKCVIDLRKNKWQQRGNVKGLKKMSSMLNGVIGLTKNKWQQNTNFEGLNKIEEVHRDVSKERKVQGEGTSSARRIPMDSSQNNGNVSVSLPAAASTKDKPKLEVSDKTNQALHDSSRGMSSVPSLLVPKQHIENNDTCVADQSKARDTHVGIKEKKDSPVSSLPLASQMPKPSGISMTMPYHQSQIQSQVGDGSEVTDKKYSRDFLLKFAEQCTDLPEGFEITADLADTLMSSNISSRVIERDSHPSAGTITDRSGGMSRMECRGSGVIVEDKWRKIPNAVIVEDKWRKIPNAFHSGTRLRRIKDRSSGMSRMDRRGSGVIDEDKWGKVPNAFHSGTSLGRITNRSGGMSRMDRRGSGVIDEDKWGKVPNAFHSGTSLGRITDRSGGMSRMDRRGSGVIDEDKWGKVPNAFHSGTSLDSGIGGNAGFRPGQGGNYWVLRNPRTLAPMHGEILSGPKQPMVNQGGMQRNNLDGERWQRAANFQQRVLIPSPSQSPLEVMHKAEKKYEVGKVADEEQAKQRQLKGILNKLTPQNFEKLFEKVKEINIDNADTLTGLISQIFEKALIEPTFCEMYANFCFHLAAALPDLSQDNEEITFKRLLLNKCQEEFEKETNARWRILGNIRFIRELYKKGMLTDSIIHNCIKKLMGLYKDPDEDDDEASCEWMTIVGNKHEIGKVGDEKKSYQRLSKAVTDDRLDQLFSRLDNFQLFVRQRLDRIDNRIASLDFQVRRLQHYHPNSSQVGFRPFRR